MRGRTLWVLLVVPGVVLGQSTGEPIRRCVAADGAVSYQQSPCGASQRLERVIDGTPEPPPTAGQREAERVRAERARAESAFLSRAAGTDRHAPRTGDNGARIPIARDRRACERAKRDRARALEHHVSRRVGVQTRRWYDEQVNAACR